MLFCLSRVLPCFYSSRDCILGKIWSCLEEGLRLGGRCFVCAMDDSELQRWSPFSVWSVDPALVLSDLEKLDWDTSLSEDVTHDEILAELETLIQTPEIVMDDNAVIVNVAKPETGLVPACQPASVRCKLPNFVWLVYACNRFSNAAAAAAASLRAKVPHGPGTLWKGVMKKKDKYACEMRIMKKMQKEKNKPIGKVWLGTFKTQAQAARAHDVGKFFFNSKQSKSFFDPNSEDILSKLSYLLAQPLEELVGNVRNLAKHYGEYGSIHNFNF